MNAINQEKQQDVRVTYLVFAIYTTDFSCEGCTEGNDLMTLVRTLSSVEFGDKEVRKREVYTIVVNRPQRERKQHGAR